MRNTKELEVLLKIEENIFELQEHTILHYLVHYAAPYTGSGEYMIPAGVRFALHGPMRPDAWYMHMVEENDILVKQIFEHEKLKLPKVANRLSGFTFYITKDELEKLNLKFVAGSRKRLIDSIRILKGEPLYYPKLLGQTNFYNSTPLKGTKYVESLPADKVSEVRGLMFTPKSPDFAPCSVREVAEECNWIHIGNLQEYDNKTFQAIKACYRQAMEDGLCEAVNILGVLACNYERDDEEGIRLLKQAVSMGSQNAMLNLFTVYWSNIDKYDEAITLLHEVEGKQNPSLKCLYNLAYLYYIGEDCPHNTIEKDVERSKEILTRIINYDPSRICGEGETETPAIAGRFLDFILEH